jgi:SAM-dependent methyltransferase
VSSPPPPDHEFVRASRGARTFPGALEENYWFRRHQAAYREAVRLLAGRMASGRPLLGPGTGLILEAGCGEGYGADVLRRAGRVVAVDLDPVAVARMARAHAAVPVVRADACQLPFASGSFDAIVGFQLLEHLYCPAEFLETAGALLTPGGVLLLSTPNRDKAASADGRPNPFHVHEYTAGELAGLLRARFERVRLGGIHAGSLLGALDGPSGGPLQHRLARTPFDELPRWLRLAVWAFRAHHFRFGPPSGSLDLLAVAEQPSRRAGRDRVGR